ncbi:proline dehydrogenase [Subtercola boreus]|uniref:Proline dehydrogenase n=1 Tax=Subtercola boreus TaxID=120213 RepID=A0A3E0VPV9_9MICO|nr:(2Fe-2S)-binding protein [Subtercola boreus]RFA11550.1 proline dehydrogenase [Subtercola boreus]
MTSFLLPPSDDPIRPAEASGIRIAVDGRPVDGLAGQSIAGVLLGSGTLAWRTTSKNARPRGVFCGIGVCYDCLVEVNGQRDVRACQRRAADGDTVSTQYDALPEVAEPIELPGEADGRA